MEADTSLVNYWFSPETQTAIVYLGQDCAYSDLPTTTGFYTLSGDGNS